MAKTIDSKGKKPTSKTEKKKPKVSTSPKKTENQSKEENIQTIELEPDHEHSVIVIDEPVEIEYEKNGIKIFKIRNRKKHHKQLTAEGSKTSTHPAKKKVKPVAKVKPKKTKPVKESKPIKPRKEPKNNKGLPIEEKVETVSFGSGKERNYIVVEPLTYTETGIKAVKAKRKRQKQLTSKYSKGILEKDIVTTTNYKPNIDKHIIELHHVRKSYVTGDLETPVLKGMNIVLDKGDFIVILGPSGSGKTTFLNIISGLDKATEGDVFVLGANLTLLKDSHLTKFRRRNVGFIFQQYNLLTNLTAKENAEVGENLSSNKNPDMTIEDIFITIGMKDQMNKYPHQMSGGQQQRVSIARALAKNPEILFADEPTGALDEEMGRKVLEILVQVNKQYKTTVIVVTHNPNIAKIGNTVIHIKNGLIDEVIKNAHPVDPSKIDWS